MKGERVRIDDLQRLGFTVKSDGECLVVAPQHKLTDQLREAIRSSKAELLAQIGSERVDAKLQRTLLMQEALRQWLLEVIRSDPTVNRAFLVEEFPNAAGHVAVGVRGIGTCGLVIPAGRFDLRSIIRTLREAGDCWVGMLCGP